MLLKAILCWSGYRLSITQFAGYFIENLLFSNVFQFAVSSTGVGDRELEVTDLNNSYLRGGKLRWSELNGFWQDAGSFESLYEVNTYWRNIRMGGKER